MRTPPSPSEPMTTRARTTKTALRSKGNEHVFGGPRKNLCARVKERSNWQATFSMWKAIHFIEHMYTVKPSYRELNTVHITDKQQVCKRHAFVVKRSPPRTTSTSEEKHVCAKTSVRPRVLSCLTSDVPGKNASDQSETRPRKTGSIRSARK